MRVIHSLGAAALVLSLLPVGLVAQRPVQATPARPASTRDTTVAATQPMAVPAGMPAAASIADTAAPGERAPAAAAVPLSLTDALGRALSKSEEVRTAQAQVDAAAAQVKSARSSLFPQVSTQLSYNRTLRSPFQNSGISLPDSMRFDPDPNASIEDRLSYLEKNAPLAGLSGLSGAFSNLPFGQANTWVAGLTVTQPIFAGGRIRAGLNAAEAGESAAQAQLTEAQADIALQVKEAYYDAALADRSVGIVEGSVELARRHLAEIQLQRKAGRASELDEMKAQVDVDNLEPQLVQAENARDLALLNLKRLINLPTDAVVSLTTTLDAGKPGTEAVASLKLPDLDAASAQLQHRSALQAAQDQVEVRTSQLSAAKGAYLPSLALTGTLNRQAYPLGAIPGANDWRDDWSVGLALQWSPFDGFKRQADVQAARAQVEQAELERDQLAESVRMSYQQALGELKRAQSQVAAASSTVAQAERVYQLTEMRYREGLTTQLDVSNSRQSLQQAQLNQVQALHDAYVAAARAERALGTPLDRMTMPAG